MAADNDESQQALRQVELDRRNILRSGASQDDLSASQGHALSLALRKEPLAR